MKAVGLLQPAVSSYAAAIDACSKAGQYEKASELLSEMKAVGLLQPDESSYTAAIDACSKSGNVQLAL